MNVSDRRSRIFSLNENACLYLPIQIQVLIESELQLFHFFQFVFFFTTLVGTIDNNVVLSSLVFFVSFKVHFLVHFFKSSAIVEIS